MNFTSWLGSTLKTWEVSYLPINFYRSAQSSKGKFMDSENIGRPSGWTPSGRDSHYVLLQPLPAVTFRAIGGIFDFYFFLGPTPADVIRQFTELVGRPFLPPYWSLGFHLCKYGYGSVENTRAVWQRTRDAKIPFDVQYNDIDYMHNQNDFTIDPVKFHGLDALVDDIKKAGMHYVMILDPGVSASEPKGTYPPYDDGIAQDIFIKNEDGSVFVGKVWNPNSTVFPDFTNPKVDKYWTKQIRKLHELIPFDGLWIDMNEPANFLNGTFTGCPKNELETPPYVPDVDKGKLNYKTLCMSAKQYAGNHYDLHNLYGISESEVTQRSVEEIIKKRAFILSRSTFTGSGKYTAHWTGDNFSTWHDMTKSIPALLSFSLYGIPFVGADICGFIGNATTSLCNRWMQLGAFYPFSRNHNSLGNADQDPAILGEKVVASSINSLTIRYFLLPYLYTLFYRAHVSGDTVARPLFFEYPKDAKTYEVDRSFLWGSGLYVIPICEDKSQKVVTYLPSGKWYDWYNLTERTSKGEEVTLEADDEHIPLLIRGGIVFPMQKPALTTFESRKNKFTFLAAPNAKGSAWGELFWDDGISLKTIENKNYGLLNFNLTGHHFVSQVLFWNVSETPTLETIKILGTKNVHNVTLNKQELNFENTNSVLTITNINLPLNVTIDLTWS
ncbi:hypothetical protein RUM44_009761 [Polyplax serrata]|uniref:Uncharacterized protein n=1 Tax=Polyplax serrata TaxID=468196 RepID=A0ABR1ATK9_POLSC